MSQDYKASVYPLIEGIENKLNTGARGIKRLRVRSNSARSMRKVMKVGIKKMKRTKVNSNGSNFVEEPLGKLLGIVNAMRYMDQGFVRRKIEVFNSAKNLHIPIQDIMYDNVYKGGALDTDTDSSESENEDNGNIHDGNLPVRDDGNGPVTQSASTPLDSTGLDNRAGTTLNDDLHLSSSDSDDENETLTAVNTLQEIHCV